MEEQLGKVTEWRDDRGFGFIEARDGGERIFFHVRDYQLDGRRPEPGEWVKFRKQRGQDGRWQGAQVRRTTSKKPAREASPKPRKSSASTPMTLPAPMQWLLIAAYTAFFAWAIRAGRLPMEAAGVPLLLSAITWVAYALDKYAAQHGRWRTPEATLHLLELLGGWPGAIAAQQWLRHKSRKAGYRFTFWSVTVLHLVVLTWWVFRHG